eukprot:354806-Chlamydomonas_euryale.AAC.1
MLYRFLVLLIVGRYPLQGKLDPPALWQQGNSSCAATHRMAGLQSFFTKQHLQGVAGAMDVASQKIGTEAGGIELILRTKAAMHTICRLRSFPGLDVQQRKLKFGLHVQQRKLKFGLRRAYAFCKNLHFPCRACH